MKIQPLQHGIIDRSGFPEERRGWISAGGRWQIADGILWPDPGNFVDILPDSGAVYYTRAFSDFVLTARLRILHADVFKLPGDAFDGADIMFRSPDDHSGYAARFLSCGLDGRPGWNHVILERRAPGCYPREIARAVAPVQFDVWHDVEIACAGDTVAIALDGRRVIEAADDAYRAGLIGFRCSLQPCALASVEVEGEEAAVRWNPRGTPTAYCERIVSNTMDGGGDTCFSAQIVLTNGDILLSHRVAPNHVGTPTALFPEGGRTRLRRSVDGGLRWSEPWRVAGQRGMVNEFAMRRTLDGGLQAVYSSHHYWMDCGEVDPVHGRPDLLTAVWKQESRDEGRTWTPAEWIPLDHAMYGAFGGWMPFGGFVEMGDGYVVIPAYVLSRQSREGYADTKMRIGALVSDDDGRSWRSVAIPETGTSWVVSEPAACRLQDGTIFLVAREETAGSMWMSRSSDRGLSWSVPQPVGFAGHSPFALVTSRGALVVAHRYPGTSIHVSLDGGRTWGPNCRISEAGGAYPWMSELDDGRIFVSYSHFRHFRPNVLFGQFLKVDGDGVAPA